MSSSTPLMESATETEGSEKMIEKPSGESRDDTEEGEKIEDSDDKTEGEEQKPKFVSADGNPSSSTPLMENATDPISQSESG